MQGSALQMGPITCKLSKEQLDVDPKIVETKNGNKPFSLSLQMASSNVCLSNDPFSSGSRIRTLTRRILAAFSTQEWASLEQYPTSFGRKALSSISLGQSCFVRKFVDSEVQDINGSYRIGTLLADPSSVIPWNRKASGQLIQDALLEIRVN
ncbi:hypothetical protein HUJ05_008178 [Dendroctonus ponderosae]|nr:hypothetical protein HUJ05_008178 [Dendroctonus ponderosae]